MGAMVVILFGICVGLYTQNSDLPDDYHPDERSKAKQLIGSPEAWNYHHPLFMMETANLMYRWSNASNNSFDVTIVGRWNSAILASIAVVAFAMTGYVSAGSA